jgi:hypothetical protein
MDGSKNEASTNLLKGDPVGKPYPRQVADRKPARKTSIAPAAPADGDGQGAAAAV